MKIFSYKIKNRLIGIIIGLGLSLSIGVFANTINGVIGDLFNLVPNKGYQLDGNNIISDSITNLQISDSYTSKFILKTDIPSCTGINFLQWNGTNFSCETYTAPVVTCSSWTYSEWGACQPNNTRTKSVISSSPIGCTGGIPVTTGACTYSTPITYSWYTGIFNSCSATCGGGTQTRTVVCKKSDGYIVGDSFCSGTKPSTSNICNIQPCPKIGCSSGGASFQYCQLERPAAAHGIKVAVTGGGTANGFNRIGGGYGTCDNGLWVDWAGTCNQNGSSGNSCPSGNLTYLNCDFSRPITTNGGQISISNSNPGHSGLAGAYCNNGNWENVTASCSY